jgi:hypothetical protein
MGLPTYARCDRSVARVLGMRHTSLMTMLDLGPERPGQASETRQWAERGQTENPSRVSNRRFFIVLAIIVVALLLFALVR